MRVIHISLDNIVLCGDLTTEGTVIVEVWRRYSTGNMNHATRDQLMALRNRLDNPAFNVEGVEYCRECFSVDEQRVDHILAISSMEGR